MVWVFSSSTKKNQKTWSKLSGLMSKMAAFPGCRSGWSKLASTIPRQQFDAIHVRDRLRSIFFSDFKRVFSVFRHFPLETLSFKKFYTQHISSSSDTIPPKCISARNDNNTSVSHCRSCSHRKFSSTTPPHRRSKVLRKNGISGPPWGNPHNEGWCRPPHGCVSLPTFKSSAVFRQLLSGQSLLKNLIQLALIESRLTGIFSVCQLALLYCFHTDSLQLLSPSLSHSMWKTP